MLKITIKKDEQAESVKDSLIEYSEYIDIVEEEHSYNIITMLAGNIDPAHITRVLLSNGYRVEEISLSINGIVLTSANIGNSIDMLTRLIETKMMDIEILRNEVELYEEDYTQHEEDDMTDIEYEVTVLQEELNILYDYANRLCIHIE